ncbi:MBL fold metallo-hydrolase [Paenibacillus dokdonensis]|uniref:MBL fold metallo-hydrolase n=1 Tax=Paenibacillus dokdonensis TaxID=2567944 RepID=A0ABU6GY73_9BACL|nr:MBL fold metallo-hydrolase [Paenibacillus dokdonensis]MEC0243685.1 MBL fold metallo-hydrolase [Paenibacillus dokdonensis]
MKIQLIRNASLWLEYAGSTFLIDPMFSAQGANPPVFNTENDRRNPLVPLPFPIENWVNPDVILLTHLHPDHWDQAAIEALDKSLPLLCQPGDDASVRAGGFTDVTELNESFIFKDTIIFRTTGQHGVGEIGKLMGQVSGYVFKAEGEPTLYIAGDTIWCDDVKHALDEHHPDFTLVNAGGARFLAGGPIIMNEEDVVSLCRYAPYTKIAAIHMESINHCFTTRSGLNDRLHAEQLNDQVQIPLDGEWF